MLSKNIFSMAIFLSLATHGAQAGEVQIRPDHPQQYTVVKGDTLWDISGRFLAEPWRWPEIWRGNPHIENPHLIYPGDIITLIWEDGKPVLMAGDGSEMDLKGEMDDGSSPVSRAVDRNVKLSPQVKVVPRGADAIPSIPLEAIYHFLERPRLMAKEELEALPYVVDNAANLVFTTVGDKVYVRGLRDPKPGDRYSVYTKGNEYRSSRSNEVLGYEMIRVGEVTLTAVGDPSSAVIVKSDLEMRVGDRLFVPEREEHADTHFVPSTPRADVGGRIISVVGSLFGNPILIGQHMVVVLDVGSEHGLETGHVLGVYQPSKVVGDRVLAREKGHYPEDYYVSEQIALRAGHSVRLPEERVGVVMVFKTLEKLSYAIVMNASNSIQVLDRVSSM